VNRNVEAKQWTLYELAAFHRSTLEAKGFNAIQRSSDQSLALPIIFPFLKKTEHGLPLLFSFSLG